MSNDDTLAHALLAWTNFETMDYLRNESHVSTARLQTTWVDLVRHARAIPDFRLRGAAGHWPRFGLRPFHC